MSKHTFIAFKQPLLNYARSTNERMFIVSLCALFAIAQSAFMDKGGSLFIAIAAITGAVITELLINLASGKFCLRDGSVFVTALVLTLFLPNTINPFFAACGAAFAIAVVKHSFGGLGANWLNPALGGWLFIYFSWPNIFKEALQLSPLTFISNYMRESGNSAFTSPVQLFLKSGFGVENGGAVTNFLNKSLFSLFNREIPHGYMDFFINSGPGLIADRGILALIAGSVLMCGLMAGRSYLSVIYLGVFLVFIQLENTFEAVDTLYFLFSGGVFAAALFITAEPVTSPKFPPDKIVYVAAMAFFTYFFRYVKAESCGAIFAAVLVNIFSPLIKTAEEYWRYEKKTVIKENHI
jgi:electron transport complex protein RnfD